MTVAQLFDEIVSELVETGVRKAEAKAVARKLVSVYDVIEVDPRTGEGHVRLDGPSIFDQAAVEATTGKDGDGDGNGVPEEISRQTNR